MSNYLVKIISKQIYLTHQQVQPVWDRVDQGVMAMMGYSTFPELLNWILTTAYSLGSYLGHAFFLVGRGFYPSAGDAVFVFCTPQQEWR